MTNYFVDSTNGFDGDNTGLSMDDDPGEGDDGCWATLEYAMETGSLAPGDFVWVRRLHDETPGGSVSLAYSGDNNSLITFSGWPRAADTSISSATWTQGSKTVGSIVGLSMGKYQHTIRFLTAPDGQDYLIAVVNNSSTITLDREYAGADATSTAGACTVKADELWADDMGDEYGFDDSGWIIKETDWDADADNLPTFGYNDGQYTTVFTDTVGISWENMSLIDSKDADGLIYASTNCKLRLRGLMIENTQLNRCCLFVIYASVFMDRCYLDTASTNIVIPAIFNHGQLFLNDVVFNSSDGYHIDCETQSTCLYMNNVHFGPAANDDLIVRTGLDIRCKDVFFTASVSIAERDVLAMNFILRSENHNKVLGAHKVWNALGEITKVDVVAGSGDPHKRSGGADSVLEILYDVPMGVDNLAEGVDWLIREQTVFEHEFEATTDSRRYRYYVQSEKGEEPLLPSKLWIEVEYVSAYGEPGGSFPYVTKKVTSDESIAERGDASDWSQYMEVEGIEPAVGSKVRIKCYCSFYDGEAKLYIDPLVEIT